MMLELTKELNEYAKNNQDKYDFMLEEDLNKALYYIDNLEINNDIDVLVFLLAMNLCNAYSKKVDNHNIYKFKKSIGTIIHVLNNRHIDNINICRIQDKGSLYIFKIGNIQFSFHDEKVIEIDPFYHLDMVWDGIKKQPSAKTLFYMVIDNPITDNCRQRFGGLIKDNI